MMCQIKARKRQGMRFGLEKGRKAFFLSGVFPIAVSAAIIVTIFLSSSVYAGEKIVCDLPNCIDIALSNHPDLKKSEALISYNEAKLLKKKNKFSLPSLDLTANLAYANGEPIGTYALLRGFTEEGIIVRHASGEYYNFKAELDIPVFKEGTIVFQKPPSVLESENDLKSQEFKHSMEKRDVIYDVTKTYLVSLKALEDVSFRESQVAYYKLEFAKAMTRFRSEIISRIELLKHDAALSTAEAELIEARNDYANSIAGLAFAMGIDPSTEIELKESSMGLLPSGGPEILIETAQQNREDVRAQLFAIEREKAAAEVSEREGFPEISFVTQYGLGDDFHLPNNSYYYVGLKFRINLLDFVSKKAKVQEAKAHIRKEEAILRKMKLEIAREVTEVFNNIKTLKHQIASLAKQRDEYLEKVKLAEERFAKDLIPEVTLVKAKMDFTKVDVNMKKAQHDLGIKIALLERESGTTMKRIPLASSYRGGEAQPEIAMIMNVPVITSVYPESRIRITVAAVIVAPPLAYEVDESSEQREVLLRELSRTSLPAIEVSGAYVSQPGFEDSRNYFMQNNGTLFSDIGMQDGVTMPDRNTDEIS